MKKLLAIVDDQKCQFVTDDWEGFHRLIPQNRLFTGKDLTVPIEQSNSDVRNQAARFIRRHKSSSRALEMVDFTLRIVNKFRDKTFLAQMCVKFMTSFG